MNYSARRTHRTFVPASATAFFDRYPFVRREDESLVREILASINTPQALAEMLRSIDDDEPPFAGVAYRIDEHLSPIRGQAAHDTDARERIYRLTRISGVLVREVLGLKNSDGRRTCPRSCATW